MNNVIQYFIRAKDETAAVIRGALERVKGFVSGVFSNLMNIKAGLDMVRGAAMSFLSQLKKAFAFETMTVQFKMLLGNLTAAKQHMKDLQELGNTPPFSLEQFAAASRQLLIMTQGALGFKNSLEMVGDVAAATGQSIETVSHAVGLAYAVIKDGQPLSRATMQLRNMGIITPKLAADLDELQKAGASNEVLWRKFTESLLSFKGAMAETEKTADGLIGAIGAQWDNAVRTFGAALLDVTKGGLSLILEKMKELAADGTIEKWAEKARNAIYTVIGAVKALMDGSTRTSALAALGDIIIGAFERAARSAITIIARGASALGAMIAEGFKKPIDNFAAKQVALKEEYDKLSVGEKLKYHTSPGFYDEVQARADVRAEEIAQEMARQQAEENSKKLNDLYKDDGTDRFEQGINAFKKIGEEIVAERTKLLKLEEGKAKEIPRTKEDEEKRVADDLAAAQKERDKKLAQEKAKAEAEAREKAQREVEKKLHAERLNFLNDELSKHTEARSKAETRLADAQAKVQQAWGWYRDKDSLAAQLAEEKANAEAEKQFEKDFAKLKDRRRDWRTAKNLSLDDEAVRRVGLAREEEAAAKKALESIDNNVATIKQEIKQLKMAEN